MEKQRIEVNHVFKSFKEKEVLKDVSLKIGRAHV